VDVTERLRGGGISMTVTDGIGYKADTLQIVIDDHNGIVAAPSTGTKLSARGGYRDGEIREFGDFIVDQVSFSGWPQQITIDAQSVAAASAAKEKESKDFRAEEYPTYGDIFRELAGKAGLSLHISADLADIANEYEAQGEEDNLEFATRLGRKIDATVSVKSGRMIVAKRGSGLSASGKPMPDLTAAIGVNLLSYSATWMDKPKHSNVRATWYDRKSNRRVIVETETGLEGPAFLIREPFQSQEEAIRAAAAKANELKRGQANAQFTINGAPGARAGANVLVSGARPSINGAWYVKSVTHNFSSSAPYTTNLECELPTVGARKSAQSTPDTETAGLDTPFSPPFRLA
jgi:phage protein D